MKLITTTLLLHIFHCNKHKDTDRGTVVSCLYSGKYATAKVEGVRFIFVWMSQSNYLLMRPFEIRSQYSLPSETPNGF